MQLRVVNIAGIERAEIALVPGINLLAGDLGQGKSSLLRALALALAGVAQPPSWGKGKHKTLLRDGTKAGSIEIAGPDGTVTLRYPKGELATTGRPPTAGALAIGLVNVADMDAKERAGALAALLRSDVTETDIAAALRGSGMADALVPAAAADAWTRIAEKGGGQAGCDLAKDAFEAEARTLKGAWQTVSGANWGSDIAAGWTPEGWSDDLATAAEAALAQAVAGAKAARDRAVATQAVGADRTSQIERQAGRVAQHAAKVKQLEADQERAVKALADAEAKLDALPKLPGTEPTTACPCCNATLAYDIQFASAPNHSTVTLRKPRADTLSAEQRASVTAERAVAEKAVANASGTRSLIDNALSAERAYLKGAQQAQADLEKAKARAAAVPADADALGAAAAVATAEARLRRFVQKRDADACQAKIARALEIAAVLKPDGVRKTKLLRVLDTLNDSWLAPLCHAAGWGAVRVTPDMDVTYAGRPVGRTEGESGCSQSERWRARAVLATAVAAHTDGLVLLDAAEIMVGPTHKEELIAMIEAAEVTAVLGMAFGDPSNVPDLAAAGMGATWWIAGGTARPLAEIRQQQAA